MCTVKFYQILHGDLNLRSHKRGASTFPLCSPAVIIIYDWLFFRKNFGLLIKISIPYGDWTWCYCLDKIFKTLSGLELATALPWSEHFTPPSVYFLVRTVSLSQIYCILHGSRRGPYLYGLRCGHQSSGALSADTRELSLAHAPSYGEKLSDLCLIRFPSLDRLAFQPCTFTADRIFRSLSSG